MLTQVERIQTEEAIAYSLRTELAERGIEGAVRVRWGPDPETTIEIGPRRWTLALWSFAPSRAMWGSWVADIVTHCLGAKARQARAA